MIRKGIRQVYSHNFQILYLKTYISISFVQYLSFKNLQANSLEMEYIFLRKMFRAIRGLDGVNSQKQLNLVSSRLIFEETSVDSCSKSSSN